MTFIAFKNRDENLKIMVRAANWIGDAISTTPVIRALKKNFPNAKVVLLAKAWVIPVYEYNPYINEIMVYDANSRHKKGLGTLRLAKDLKEQKFDFAVLFQNAFEAALIAFLARIKQRLGYNTDCRGFLLNKSIKLKSALKKGHIIDYYLGLLKGADLINDGKKLDLFICRSDIDYAEKFLKDQNFDLKHPVIGINPGATGGKAKRWFPKRYAKLCERLGEKLKNKILIFGGAKDKELGEYILKQFSNNCINIAGTTTLGQSFALIQKCSLFITNDSGLMHAAAALNINQIVIIGPTNYIATAPLNKNSVIVREPLDCSPCLKDSCKKGHHKCMQAIDVEMVFKECALFLKKE